MARTVYVSGNDGSGKSTFLKSLGTKLESSGLRPVRRHYYDSVFRTAIRGGIEQLLGVNRKKKARKSAPSQETAQESSKVDKPSKKRSLRGSAKRIAVTMFLWGYQSLMGVEARWRDVTKCNRVLLVDRSYIDDLVSIVELLDIPTPVALVKWSVWIFPVRSLYYLTAGSEEEFARIVDLDLSPETHRRKHERYQELMEIVESAGGEVRRINTSAS